MLTAYSYLRFSSPQQSTGDSIRRQTAARDKWLAEHSDVSLDASLVMTDAGRSGYKRKDWDAYALAAFVEAIKSGRVAKGSYLLVENLDRLSRENAGDATELFLSIVNRGIVIVQLSPVVIEFKKPVDMTSLMFAIVELSRGHSESAIKSERSRASWGRKQKEAGAKIVTKKLPGWISCANGKLALNSHAATVRRMFLLACSGEGTQAIALKLNAENVPVMGRETYRGKPVKWSGANVWHILRSRACIGEYIPYKRRGKMAGQPVADYFPRVVDDVTYHAAQAAIKNRGRVGRGRKGKHVNLFAGLMVDARDGGSLTYWHTGKHPANIISVNAKEGKGIAWVAFPADLFERALRSKLSEVKADDINGTPTASKLELLKAERDEIDTLTKAWEAKMDNPLLVNRVAEKLAELYVRRNQNQEEIADLEAEAATPMHDVWEEARTLAGMNANDDTDEVRQRIKNALRRCIESVAVLIVPVPNTRTKLAAARVQFRNGRHREYVIAARSVCGNRKDATWEAESFPDAGLPDGADLRDTKQAAKLEALLVKHTAKK